MKYSSVQDAVFPRGAALELVFFAIKLDHSHNRLLVSRRNAAQFGGQNNKFQFSGDWTSFVLHSGQIELHSDVLQGAYYDLYTWLHDNDVLDTFGTKLNVREILIFGGKMVINTVSSQCRVQCLTVPQILQKAVVKLMAWMRYIF
jgi:hypothetical protein